MHHIGILAYGSLITDPGDELLESTQRVVDNIRTPFKVEFARSSKTRDGAPTLVPVESGGSRVNATLFILKNHVGREQAQNMLWRRETNQPGSSKRYMPRRRVTDKTVVVSEYSDFGDVEVVFFTKIASNISPLTSLVLATLAVSSARAHAGSQQRDGISYLINAKKVGIVTPLIGSYEHEVLRLTGTESLADAWRELAEK